MSRKWKWEENNSMDISSDKQMKKPLYIAKKGKL